MLVGQSPFSGCDEDELFWSICNEIPWYPHYLSKEALKLLQSVNTYYFNLNWCIIFNKLNVFLQLLEKDCEIRLGSIQSMEDDIRYHTFFNSIDWERLEKRALEPPFKPEVVSS
jgi:novel protein kinase C delta type